MADIKVASTGKVFYQIDNSVAAVLLEAFPKSFARVEKPAFNVAPSPSRAKERWVVQHPFTGQWEIVHINMIGETRYPAPGIAPSIEIARSSFAATGHPVPQEILDQFAKALAGNVVDAATQFEIDNEKRLRQQYEQESADAAATRKITG
jgi:hypothetical protein